MKFIRVLLIFNLICALISLAIACRTRPGENRVLLCGSLRLIPLRLFASNIFGRKEAQRESAQRTAEI